MYLRFDGRRLNRNARKSGTAVSGVGEIVDGVREQADGTRERHDRELHERGRHQRDERQLDGAHATLARFERLIDRVGGVVAVRVDDIREGAAETPPVLVLMSHALRLLAW